MTMRISGLKPGQSAPVAGLYQQVGPRGGRGSARTVDKGERLPSTSKPGSTYTLVDRTADRANGASPGTKPKLVLVTKKGSLLPGVDIDSRAKLYDLMDGLG